MELRNLVAFKTFHLLLFPMDIWFVSLNPPEIFHSHATTMATITRLVHRRTLKKLVSSKESPPPGPSLKIWQPPQDAWHLKHALSMMGCTEGHLSPALCLITV